MKKIRYQSDLFEHFIPISLNRLIVDLLDSNLLLAEQNKSFKQFCASYRALFHAQTHSELQQLKQIYQPFNPDRDSLIDSQENTDSQLARLKNELYSMLEKANYEKLSEDQLNAALNKISPHGVKVSVDFDEFAEVALFFRGSAIHTKLHRNWKRFKFKKEPIEVQIYRRLFVLIQPKNREQWISHLTTHGQMSLTKATKKVNASLKSLGISGNKDVVYIKLFKDIPRADLEMLFPNTRIQIRLFDKIKLGVMGGGGTAGGVMATITKLSAAIDPVSAMIAIGGLLGIIWRQIAKIFSQRAKYSAILTKNLYFYSLSNNMGALTYLVDSAESEECKEAILTYFFLLQAGESRRADLDKGIEQYIQQQYAIPMNFEIDDGLNKLQKNGLLLRYDEMISAKPLSDANTQIKQQWNNIIKADSV